MVDIREVQSPEGMKEIFPVAMSAWGMERPESFITDMLNALEYHGGLVLGAYDEGRMIGFQYSFIGRKGDLFYLYSHMTGILEERKYGGVGLRLKQAQREWARKNGFRLIAWTYDPLMSMNAVFNIRKLGAIARTYLPNFYGAMVDRLNAGSQTDRFVAEWWVESDRRPVEFDPGRFNTLNATGIIEGDFRKISAIYDATGDEVVVEIPYDYVSLKSRFPGEASEWRSGTRRIFSELFRNGYTAVSSKSSGGRTYYLLSRRLDDPAIPHDSPFRI